MARGVCARCGGPGERWAGANATLTRLCHTCYLRYRDEGNTKEAVRVAALRSRESDADLLDDARIDEAQARREEGWS